MAIRDIRRSPFCWQDKAALRALRCYYAGERLKQRSTAIAIYVALTEAASNQHRSDAAEVIHLAIADATGTSRSTVKRYLSEFEDIGLIAVERRKVTGGANLPNLYALLSLPSRSEPQGSTTDGGVPSTDEPQGSTDGRQQEEPLVNNDYQESDEQWAWRYARDRGLTRREARVLASAHTAGQTLNRATFLAALPPRPR